MSAQSSLYENKVLFTKPFKASSSWHPLKDLVFINWKKHCFKNEWILTVDQPWSVHDISTDPLVLSNFQQCRYAIPESTTQHSWQKKNEFLVLRHFGRCPANHLHANRNDPSINILTHFALIPSLVQPWAQWVILYCLLL